MYLIKSNDVKGDVNIGSFKECFKVLSVEFESGRQTMQASLGSSARKFGPVRVSPIRIQKAYCKASPTIQETCNFGKISDCKIAFLDNNNAEYLEVTLKDALFSNYAFVAHGGELPHESFDITYTGISCNYTLRNEKGLPNGNPKTVSFNLSTVKK